jgi:membrane protease YdiL (CAAX protease family)
LSRRSILLEMALAWAGATAAVAALYWSRLSVPFIARNLHALVAVVFIGIPFAVLERRRADWAAYGWVARPYGRNLAWAAGAAAVVFPLFLVGFVLYYRGLCALWRPSFCGAFLGFAGARLDWPVAFLPPPTTRALGWLRFVGEHPLLTQIIVIGIPEELFFRGYLYGRLREAFPPEGRLRVLGVPIGAAALASSALFGLGHFLVDFHVDRLAVFFPALAFVWLRERTGSIAPGALFHALCNLYIETLHRSFFG